MDLPPVQYVKTSDGYDIAYTVSGAGRTIVFFPILFVDVQARWRQHASLLEGLAERFRVVSFDFRGEGMSTRGLRSETTMADYDLDTEAVIEQSGTESVVLFAFGTRGHHAVRYATKHPDKVAAIIWHGAAVRNSAWPASMWVDMPAENWNLFLQSLAPRDIDIEEVRRRVREYESCIRWEDWQIRTTVNRPSDIQDQLRELSIPMLVTHARGHVTLPSEESMKVAALAPNARLALIDGTTATGDTTQMLAAIDSFIADLPTEVVEEERPGSRVETLMGLSAREREVLRLLGAGKSNQDIADELVISRNTVRRHVSNIFDKTGVPNRAQAVAYARDHGLV